MIYVNLSSILSEPNSTFSQNEKADVLIKLMYSPIYTIKVPQSMVEDIEDLAVDYILKFYKLGLKEFFNEIKQVRDASFKNLNSEIFDNNAKETGKFEVCMRLFTNEYESFTSSDINIPVEEFPKEFTPNQDRIKILKEIINEVPELIDEIPEVCNFL